MNVSLLLIGCSDSKIKEKVSSLLKDPDSAKFRNIKLFKNGNYCGEINAKNELGGYVGFKVWTKFNGEVEIFSEENIDSICEKAENPVVWACKKKKQSIEMMERYAKIIKEDKDSIFGLKTSWAGEEGLKEVQKVIELDKIIDGSTCP